jgi:hypothetical protein
MAQLVKVGRNDLCSCGSGKKFKKCCEAKLGRSPGATWMMVLIAVVLVGGALAVATSFTSEKTHQGSSTGVWDPVHGHYH